MMEEERKGEPPAVGPCRTRLLPDLGTRQCFLVKLVTVCVIVEVKSASQRKTNPIPLPWVHSTAEREWQNAMGPLHVEHIAFKQKKIIETLGSWEVPIDSLC